jgi:hypothetical protein
MNTMSTVPATLSATSNNALVKMNRIQVTVRAAHLSMSGEFHMSMSGERYMFVHGSLTVAQVKEIILTRFNLANKLTINHIVLIFLLQEYPVKFASSPFNASGTGLVPVSDDKRLETFLKGPSVIAFLLFERNSY